MEIAKLFASVGIKFNEGDIKRVDSQIKKLQSQLRSLSTNIRVKVDPIVQTAGKSVDKVGKSVTSSLDPKLAAQLSKSEARTSRAINHMERALRQGVVSKDQQPKVLAKLAATLYQLESTLRSQGKLSEASKILKKAQSTEDKGIRESNRRIKAEKDQPQKVKVAQTRAESPSKQRKMSPLKVEDKPLKVKDKTLKVEDKPLQVKDKTLKVEDKPLQVTLDSTKLQERLDRYKEAKRVESEARVARSRAPVPLTREASKAKTEFGQKQGSVRNVLQEIGLSAQVATGKLNTALVNIQAINRNAKKFDDTPFKIEGFRNALSALNKETARQVKGITQSGKSQQDQLQALMTLSAKIESNLKGAFAAAQKSGLPRIASSEIQKVLADRQPDVTRFKRESIAPTKLEDQIATLETRSGARGGFKSIKEQGDLIEAIELRKRQLLTRTASLAQKLASSEVNTRETAAQSINRIQRDITRISAIENRARARQVMDTNRQIENSFRMMAKRAFTSMNNMRIIATTATGAMASFAGITPFIQDNRTLEQLNSAFIAITGNAKDAKAMMDFVNTSSDKLGLSFKTVAQASKSFAAATQAQGVSLDETQEMLTGVFKASRVLGLSSEDTQGAIRAMAQMFGKVNVSAEELNSRLAA